MSNRLTGDALNAATMLATMEGKNAMARVAEAASADSSDRVTIILNSAARLAAATLAAVLQGHERDPNPASILTAIAMVGDTIGVELGKLLLAAERLKN